MKAVLDAGALVAVDRRDQMIGAQLRVLQQQGTPVRVSAAVVGQVWRDGRRQASLAWVLAGVGIEALGKDDGKSSRDWPWSVLPVSRLDPSAQVNV